MVHGVDFVLTLASFSATLLALLLLLRYRKLIKSMLASDWMFAAVGTITVVLLIHLFLETLDIEVQWLDGFLHLLWAIGFLVGVTVSVRFNKLVRAREIRWTHAVEQSASAVVITDVDGNIEYVNPKFTQLSGYTLEEAIGKNPRILKSGETPPEGYKRLWETITAGGEWQGEFHNKKKNGELYWVSASISPIRNLEGVITHFVGIQEDITERKKAEEALRRSDARSRALLEAMPDMMFRISRDGTFLDFVPAKAYPPAVPPSEFLGKKMGEVLQKEVAQRAMHYVEQALQTGDAQTFEYQLPAPLPKGETRDYEARIVVSGEDEVLGIVRDTTERKKAEEKIKNLARFASENPNLVLRMAKDGTILYANAAAQLLLSEWKREIGQPAPDRWRRSVADVLSSGGRSVAEIELRDQVFSFVLAPVTDAAYVNVYGYDITERKKAEEEVKRRLREFSIINEASASLAREMSLKKTLDSILDYALTLTNSESGYVGLINEDGHLVAYYKGEVWERCRVPEKSVVFKEFRGLWGYSLIHKEPVLCNDPSTDPRSTGVPEGHVPIRNFLAIPIIYEDELVGQIGVANKPGGYSQEDLVLLVTLANTTSAIIHRNRQMEQLNDMNEELIEIMKRLNEQNIRLRRLDEMKSRFISTAAHELRTPLVSIKGYTELIRSGRVGEVPKRIDDMLEVVERNANRLSTLTDDLLDQQRIETGRLQISPEILKLQDAIEDVVQEVQPFISEKKQVLNVQVPPDLGPVRADKARLGQVILNLLNNAFKFTPESGTISLEARETREMVEVQVSDNGIGIAKEDLDKLFQSFPDIQRPSITEPSTGLGLSICKGIIDLHGGKIWAKSEGKDKGTTFTFTIPRLVEAE